MSGTAGGDHPIIVRSEIFSDPVATRNLASFEWVNGLVSRTRWCNLGRYSRSRNHRVP